MRYALLLLLTTPLSAQQPWGQVVAAAGSSTVIVGDCLTTRYNLRHGMVESNPLLGPRPSSGRLTTMCGLAVLANVGVAHIFPQRQRQWWFAAVAVVEASMMAWNLTHH